jgi:acetylornithine deacetylase/succinyl-diaminopimelate desuccinylase-like protein
MLSHFELRTKKHIWSHPELKSKMNVFPYEAYAHVSFNYACPQDEEQVNTKLNS